MGTCGNNLSEYIIGLCKNHFPPAAAAAEKNIEKQSLKTET
jgi:hypothetical protein